MAEIDVTYCTLAETILSQGFWYEDKSRANISMLQVPFYQMVIDMTGKEFPLLTTKKVWWKGIAHELIWMLSGATDITYLQNNKVHIWDKDAMNFSGSNYVGRIYGAQWRSWQSSFDQIAALLKNLKENPFSRKHIVTAWNPAELRLMALPPCHWAFEILPETTLSGKFSFTLKWIQRSCDVMLGIPFDIGLYAFLGKLIEKLTGYRFKTLVGDLSNVHFYGPHINAIQKQLSRPRDIPGPRFEFKSSAELDSLTIDDFLMYNYYPMPAIKAELFTKVK